MNQPPAVLVVGSFNVDHVWQCDTLPQPGQTLSGSYRTGPGGKGFNQAIAARRAGAATRFLCALGADAGAQLARALAADDALDLRDQGSDAPTGTAGIYVDAAGRNSIVLGPGANATLDAGFVARNASAVQPRAVVLAQLETPAEATMAAFEIARDSGVATLLNPAPANVDVDAGLLALTDILTPNETEFVALLARHMDVHVEASAVGLMSSERLHGLCRDLLSHGSVVVTLGAAGCFVSHAAQARRGDDADWYRVQAAQVTAVDTTGAGDAFNGALAAAWAESPDAPFRRHVQFATAYAGRSTEAVGAAMAMPRLTPHDLTDRPAAD